MVAKKFSTQLAIAAAHGLPQYHSSSRSLPITLMPWTNDPAWEWEGRLKAPEQCLLFRGGYVTGIVSMDLRPGLGT